MKKAGNLPSCFGHLDTVFPMGKDGLRLTPERCFKCEEKTGCLRTAMAGAKGLDVKEEAVERAKRSGVIGFMERWSKKKSLRQRKKNLEE